MEFRFACERKARQMSQAELARRTGIHPVTICQLEAGKVHPYPGWKRKLADVLEIPEECLFEEVGSRDETAPVSR